MEWGPLASGLLLLALMVVNHLYAREPLYPGTLQSALWAFVLFSYWVRNESLPFLSFETLANVVYFCALFSLGCYLGSLGIRSAVVATPPPTSVDRLLIVSLLLVGAAGLPFFAMKAWEYSFTNF